MFTSSLENRMVAWLEKNPYKFYPYQGDQLSQHQVELLIDGNFDDFHDNWFSYTDTLYQYAIWDDIEAAFAEEFKFRSAKSEWPEDKSELFDLFKQIDCSVLLEHNLKSTTAYVAVKPKKQSGNYIKFPHSDLSSKDNAYLNRYNKTYLGIENSWDAETCYCYDSLTIIGKVDLHAWYKRGRKPDFFKFSPDDFVLTHNYFNGSGGLGDVVITKTRKMRYDARLDDADAYGVQQVFGFTDDCWKNQLNFIWS